MTILHVDSSIQGDTSVSRALSRAAVSHLAGLHPALAIVRRDLVAAPLAHFTAAEGADAAVLDEFLAARIVVVGAPMYNFGIPSQLKSWLDRLAVPGRSFRYGPQGPEGLCGGRTVLLVSTRGGVFSDGSPRAEMDHQEGHLRAFFGFLGVADVRIIRAEGLALGEAAQQAALQAAHDTIRQLAA
ncbi:NAD(P)H-dependent oxidoreductase [Roseomonas sp. GC11]|uniref:FMN-dependent NADH-azoreductase n=1 Tax=Roseomonas sp. GC11 TaxID=2950546 RepID=UPI00210BC4D0|nr:NAD(P)H-dependent oxidoreductase [Roseomonas sp. GC11]MCQ4160796.1 NAD(P)H-dependent oxidoreductase [Roseomonas sp. GC11]